MTAVVAGIDPGGKSTAIAILKDGELIYSHTWLRPEGADLNEYVVATVRGVQGVLRTHRPHLVGIEKVSRPNPHLGIINPQGAMDTSRMIGALVSHVSIYRRHVMVKQNKHGGHPLAAYPAQLVGPREKGVYGKGALRHERSAYDVAQATNAILAGHFMEKF